MESRRVISRVISCVISRVASRVPRLELLDEFEYSLDAATLVAKDVVVLKNHETREEATQEVRRALTPLGTLEDCRRA